MWQGSPVRELPALLCHASAMQGCLGQCSQMGPCQGFAKKEHQALPQSL